MHVDFQNQTDYFNNANVVCFVITLDNIEKTRFVFFFFIFYFENDNYGGLKINLRGIWKSSFNIKGNQRFFKRNGKNCLKIRMGPLQMSPGTEEGTKNRTIVQTISGFQNYGRVRGSHSSLPKGGPLLTVKGGAVSNQPRTKGTKQAILSKTRTPAPGKEDEDASLTSISASFLALLFLSNGQGVQRGIFRAAFRWQQRCTGLETGPREIKHEVFETVSSKPNVFYVSVVFSYTQFPPGFQPVSPRGLYIWGKKGSPS